VTEDSELRQIRELLQGKPYDREDRGLIGEVHDIKVALYGPPDRPNGIVGMIKEMRVTTRSIIVGFILAGGGVLVQKFLLT